MRILVLLNPTNKRGTIRILRLTEKQFCNMGLYQFEEDFQEEIVGINDFNCRHK